MTLALRFAGALLWGLLVGACDTVYDRDLDGPYRLQAIDTMESMAVLWEIPGGGLVGDGLPGPTVIAFGQDSKYLVAKVHPEFCKSIDRNCTAHGMNRSVTDFWYVVRAKDEHQRLPYAGIKGPFSEAAFAAEKRRLGLPEFTIRFAELE